MTDIEHIEHIEHIQPVIPEYTQLSDKQDGIAYGTEYKENLLPLDQHYSDELGSEYYSKIYPLGKGLKEASGLSRKKKRYFELRIQSIHKEGKRACELVWFPIMDEISDYQKEDIIGEMLLEKVEQDKLNPKKLIFHGRKLNKYGEADKIQTKRTITFLRNTRYKTAEKINTIIDNCDFIDKTNIEKSKLYDETLKIPLAKKITGGRTTRRHKRRSNKKVATKSRKKNIKHKRKTIRQRKVNKRKTKKNKK